MRALTSFVTAVVVGVACGGQIDGNSAHDAGTDVEVFFDVSIPDVGRRTDAPSMPDVSIHPPSCPQPADVSGFMPALPTPAKSDKTACQAKDYADFYAACFSQQATSMTCQTWGNAHKQCESCLVSSDMDPKWGPIVEGAGVATLNMAGCLELLGEHTCAVAFSNAKQCADAGCMEQCPVLDYPSLADYQKCVQAVNATGCKKYIDAQSIACSPDASPNVDKCTGGGTFESLLLKIGPVFCGP